MEFTYDLNEGGALILKADFEEREAIREMMDFPGVFTAQNESGALELLLANSELSWVNPEEIDALTDAPILGLRDENGEVTAAWGFMDYQLRSFLQDLVDKGEAVFVS